MLKHMLEADVCEQKITTDPLVFLSFVKFCRQRYPRLRLQKKGNDFCDIADNYAIASSRRRIL